MRPGTDVLLLESLRVTRLYDGHVFTPRVRQRLTLGQINGGCDRQGFEAPDFAAQGTTITIRVVGRTAITLCLGCDSMVLVLVRWRQ